MLGAQEDNDFLSGVGGGVRIIGPGGATVGRQIYQVDAKSYRGAANTRTLEVRAGREKTFQGASSILQMAP